MKPVAINLECFLSHFSAHVSRCQVPVSLLTVPKCSQSQIVTCLVCLRPAVLVTIAPLHN